MQQSTLYRFCAVTICYAVLGVYCTHVDLNEYWFTSSRVLSKEEIPNGGECTDTVGNAYNHLDEWTNNGECMSYTCFKASSANFIIKSSCREPLEAENPDPDNCVFATNDTAVYPHCCPVLDCPERQASLETTTPTPSCYDRASNYSCYTWQTLNGCNLENDTHSLFNFTWVYCRETCGFC